MCSNALRVLGLAYKKHHLAEHDTLESDLVFVGLSGMIDPIRPEVLAAVEKCRKAGVRPVMITGDHIDTAVAIGKELGIITDASEAITGAELDEISDEDICGGVPHTIVLLVQCGQDSLCYRE